TLLYKDFYRRMRGPVEGDRHALMFLRLATITMGLLPIPLALFVPDVLKVSFLAKALRLSLAVLVLLIFYAPDFGNRAGAVI
ncbi:hypothetical protein ABTM86_20090, partial [Acinetobacter baumannii]